MRIALSVCLVLCFAACAHSAPAPVVEEEVVIVCDPVSDLVATRIPKPTKYPNCGTPEWVTSARAACEADNYEACHLVGTCLVVHALSLSGADRRSYVDAEVKPVLAHSCKAGLADSCTLRAGAEIQAGVPARKTCPDFIRGAQLGDGEAYVSCMSTCLSGS